VSQRTLPPRPRPSGDTGPRAAGSRPRVGRVPRALWVLILLLAVTAAAAGLLASPLLEVRKVEVTGTQRVTPEQAIAAAGIRDGSALARVDAQGVRERVGALPAVASVAVHRSWPHTVRLVVTERTAQAYETQPGGSVHLYDAEGIDFAVASSAPAGLPQLVLPTGPTRADATRAASSVLAGLPDALRTQVSAVQSRSPSSVALLLQDGRTVLWGPAGDASDTATKAAIIATLDKDRLSGPPVDGQSGASDEAGTEGLEIDVSTPSIVVVR